MSKGTSPTKLSLAELRKRGYTCGITEKWNSFVKRRIDYLGIIDIICVHPIKKEVLGVQATTDTGGQVSKHKQKCQKNKNLKIWLDSGCKFCIHGWTKKGKVGKRKLWTLREVEVDKDA